MNLSFWEWKTWFSDVDYTIVGSGIVGLHAALRLRERFPNSNILVLEKGVLPEGASTKNAGFACFGSLSEILDDLRTHSEEEVIQLVTKRWQGLQLLRKRVGDVALDFRPYGGYELFLSEDKHLYDECFARIAYVNDLLRPVFRADVFSREVDRFGFGNINEYTLFNPFEGQLDTGKMMQALLRMAVAQGIQVLTSVEVQNHIEHADGVEVVLPGSSFKTRKLLYATNGFAGSLTGGAVKPARAQVLVTTPIPGLDIRGTFHFDRGYYYFRNIGDRILFGGGRHLDFSGETTTEMGQTEIIQQRLEQLLKDVILPGTPFEIERRWSGIMGLGAVKKPIVEALSSHVYCGVRLGGMGVAIGSLIGEELADLV